MVVNNKELVKDVPSVDRYTGLCSVCGLKDAHAWRCITWFIGAGTKFYRENLIAVKALLENLQQNKHVQAIDVSEALARLKYVEDLHKSVISDSTA